MALQPAFVRLQEAGKLGGSMRPSGGSRVLPRWTHARSSVTALLVFLAIACGARGRDPGEVPQVLRVAFPSAPVSLDPHLHNDNQTFSILANVYDALTVFDSDMDLQPALAESWHNPSDLAWRFTLRAGVTFHDGRPLMAADVVASLARAREHPRSVVSSYLTAVASVVEIDERTVEIRTAEPYPLLANKLTFVSIVPRGSPDEIRRPIGTGSFSFGSYEEGQSLVLVAAPMAWRAVPPWKEMHFALEPSAARRAELWRDGQVDLATMLGIEAPELLPDHLEKIVWQEGSAVSYLGFRVDREPFSDPQLRLGLSLALDRARAADELDGRLTPIGQLVGPQVHGHVPDIAPAEQNLGRALELLAAGGLSAGAELSLHTSIRMAGTARVVAAQLASAGLSVEVVERPWSELYAGVIAGDANLFFVTYLCSAGDASDLFDAALHSPDAERGWGGANLMRYSNPDLDRLIERASRTLDMESRRALLARGMQIALDDLPLIPLWQKREAHALRPGLSWRPRGDYRVLGATVTPTE